MFLKLKETGDSPWPVFLTPFILAPLIVVPLLTPYIYDDTVHGYCDSQFKPVYNAFRQNFGEGLEREGAAVAIYHKGRQVVNLWGGYADREAKRRWTHGTKSALFSATKAVAALSVAVLVDQGHLSYEDKVVDYWPEYGQHGKENTTVEHVMTHMAGIPYLQEEVEIHHLTNYLELEKIIENSRPQWIPGTGSGYHAVTFGFLLDALVRRADPKHRSLHTFFKEEIAEPYDLDVSIGAERDEVPWLARVTLPSFFEFARDILQNPKILPMLALMYARPDEIVYRIRNNPSWLQISYDTMVINDPEIISLPMGAVTGVGSAESLAKMFSLIMNGQLISNNTLEMLKDPTLNTWHLEKVVLWPVAKGRGFFYEQHPIFPGVFTFGHPGYGGQMVALDLKNKITIAYISNGLKTGSGELCGTFTRLFKGMYQSIRR